ncbi:MAG: glycoside hydrolase family 97 protein, partial [Oxalobacteraceae bacterium]
MRTSLLKMSLVALGMVISTGAFAAEDLMATVESPGKVLKVSLQVAPDGRLSYQVERNGQPVIAPSRLGFVLASDKPLDAGFAMERHLVTAHDSTWEQPWGERRTVRNHYSQLRVDVHQKKDGRRLAIVFRVFDDGVGFRYEFPKQANNRAVHIADELTEFVVAQPATAWWQQAGEVWALEYPIQKTPLREVGMANTPMTVKMENGTHIAFH